LAENFAKNLGSRKLRPVKKKRLAEFWAENFAKNLGSRKLKHVKKKI